LLVSPAKRARKTTRAADHTVDERIAATRLAPSERDVARFFADHRDEVLFMSAAQIGAAVGAGRATVVRTAQRLGYDGLPELKRELRDSLQSRATPSQRLGHSLDDLKRGEPVLDHVLSFQVATLNDARRSLGREDFTRAVALLEKAKRVIVYAPRPHEGLAEYFARVLRRLGKRVLFVRAAGDAEELLELDAGDVLVMVAYQRAERRLREILDMVRDAGASSILVTDTLALAMKGRYTVALSARRGSILEYPTVVVIIAVLEALLIGLSAHDRANVIAATERMSAVRTRLDATSSA
jgi:DNA-binding MurR/RpiR family transcriptional regulator